MLIGWSPRENMISDFFQGVNLPGWSKGVLFKRFQTLCFQTAFIGRFRTPPFRLPFDSCHVAFRFLTWSSGAQSACFEFGFFSERVLFVGAKDHRHLTISWVTRESKGGGVRSVCLAQWLSCWVLRLAWSRARAGPPQYITQNHVSINEGACVACSSKFKDRNQKHSETKCQT